MGRPPSCLSEVRFASILAYSTLSEPATEVSQRSQWVRDGIKRCRRDYLQRLVERTAEACESIDELAALLGPETTLVPVPRSAPSLDGDVHWPALRVCRELEQRGLCGEVVPALRRTTKIRKSAYLRQGEDRPSPEEHVATMALDHDALSLLSQRLIVVDDVVTRGSQLLGAASLLAAARPFAEVGALAALRAVSSEEVASIYDPVVGCITYDGNNRIRRRP